MQYTLTIFDNIKSRYASGVYSGTLDVFEEFLNRSFSSVIADKYDAKLFTPAIFKSGQNRSKRNVAEWGGWLAYDIDSYKSEKSVMECLLDSALHEYRFIAYSTASSTRVSPKFRLVLPLLDDVNIDVVPDLWAAASLLLPDDAVFDEAAKDVSRLYFLPATICEARKPNAYNFLHFNHADRLLDPIDILQKQRCYELSASSRRKLVETLPQKYRRDLAEHRYDQLTNTGYKWTSYADCPFWPRKLEHQYRQLKDGEGRHQGFYSIMCSVAGNAIAKGYPITADEIERLMRGFDKSIGSRYSRRRMLREAGNAIEYMLLNR